MSITAVLPNFNYASYVQDALKAVLNQTYPVSQVIVIDDGSTDDSVAKIEEVIQGRPEVILIRHQKNQGFYKTAAEGVSLVKTEFLFIGATDDCIMPNFFEQHMRCFKKSPGIGLSCSIPTLFAGELPPQAAPSKKGIDIFSPRQFAELIRMHPFWIAGNTVVHRTDAFRKFGGLQQEAQIFNDWILNYLIGFTYGIGYVPRSLAAARVHPHSMSGSCQRTEEKLFPAFDHIMAQLERWPACKELFRYSAILNDLGPPIQRYIKKHPPYWSFFLPMQLRRARLKLQRARIRLGLYKGDYPTYRYGLEVNE